MQITPVSYNYTNQKVQKNNTPAFGTIDGNFRTRLEWETKPLTSKMRKIARELKQCREVCFSHFRRQSLRIQKGSDLSTAIQVNLPNDRTETLLTAAKKFLDEYNKRKKKVQIIRQKTAPAIKEAKLILKQTRTERSSAQKKLDELFPPSDTW